MGNNQIHSTCILEGDVRLGSGNRLLPYTIIVGPVEIGDDNIIGPHVVIGSPGQDSKNPRYDSRSRRIAIGNHNIIREFCTIHKPCYSECTRVGDDNFFMHGTGINHDVRIANHVVVTPQVGLAGFSHVMEGANLGMGAMIHQHSVVGAYAMVAMGAAVTKDIKPFAKYIPGQSLSVNQYAVNKFDFKENLSEIESYVRFDRTPRSSRVRAVVEAFEKMHKASEREVY